MPVEGVGVPVGHANGQESFTNEDGSLTKRPAEVVEGLKVHQGNGYRGGGQQSEERPAERIQRASLPAVAGRIHIKLHVGGGGAVEEPDNTGQSRPSPAGHHKGVIPKTKAGGAAQLACRMGESGSHHQVERGSPQKISAG